MATENEYVTVEVPAVLTFSVRADDLEWALDDAVCSLSYDVCGVDLEHGHFIVALVEARRG